MNSIHSYRVIVVGAGIAGLTAAIALARAGHRVSVIERASEIRAGGYKVDVRGAALEVLDRLGLTESARACESHIGTGSIITPDGRRVAAMGGDTFGGRESDDLELERGDLVRLLAEATRQAGVEFRFGDTVASIAGRSVRLESGGEVDADVVIGADGLHSRVRALTFGDEAQFRRDLGHAIAVLQLPDAFGLHEEEQTYVAPGRTVLAYATRTRREARGMFLWRSDGQVPRDTAAQRALIRTIYASDTWRVPEVLAALDSGDLYCDSVSQIVMAAWSAGSVVLVGDAAHCASPASGQGTSLGLVGGWLLAHELSAQPTPQQAFTAYETRMRPFAKKNQALAPSAIKGMVLKSASQVKGTLTFLRVLSVLHLQDVVMGQVAKRIHAAATAIEVPPAAKG